MTMNKKDRWLAVVLLWYVLGNPGWVQAESTAPRSVRVLTVSDIFVPAELGDVVEAHEPVDPATQPIIIHIQESHINYEAQQHLVSILERLIQQYGLSLILVEGGQGDVSLEHLRSMGLPEHRKQVAAQYLEAGVLSGEEYLDIISDYPLVIWGVERQDLYDDNVQAFLAAEAWQERLKPVVGQLRQAAERLTPVLLDPTLNELYERMSAFDKGTLDVAGYVEALAELARRHGISHEAFPTIARYLSARTLEREMHPAEVDEEQTALLERLKQLAEGASPPSAYGLGTPVADPTSSAWMWGAPARSQAAHDALDALLQKAQEVRAGTLSQDEFYVHLERLAATSGIALHQYPALSLYLRYLKTSALVKPSVLARELDGLSSRLRRSLALSPESRTLQTILEQLSLLEKLVDLQLSPEDYQRLDFTNLAERLSQWAAFLDEQLLEYALPRPPGALVEEFEALTAALPTLQRFYEAARTRDEVLVERTLAKLADTQEPLAALITGGFHSRRITQLLKERGAGVVVITPRVSTASDERLYRAVLKYKSGYGTFDEVKAAIP